MAFIPSTPPLVCGSRRSRRSRVVCTAAPDQEAGAAAAGSSPASFGAWASALQISAQSVAPHLFDSPARADAKGSLRGLIATRAIGTDEALLTVPRAAALQVTSLDGASAVPRGTGLSRDAWRGLPWYARLALQLHVARVDKGPDARSAALHGWATALPRAPPDVLYRWSAGALAELQNARMRQLAAEQAKHYRGLHDRVKRDWASGSDTDSVPCPTKDELFWALDMVRSRSFAGPLEAAPFRERARLAAFVAVNTAVWPALHVLPLQNALNGGLTALFALAMYDILLPRILRFTQGMSLRRYALTPAIDYLNHSPAVSPRGQVSYRYFSDAFEVRSDRAYEEGEQVYISYGAQGNDSLLQYYGFICDSDDSDADEKSEQPGDTWTFDDELAQTLGVRTSSLAVSAAGFDRATVAAVRKRVGGSEEKANAALTAACKAQLQRFPTSIAEDDDIIAQAERDGKPRLALAARYRRGKKRLLESAIAKLEAKGR